MRSEVRLGEVRSEVRSEVSEVSEVSEDFAVQCSAMQCNAVQCSAVQFSAVQCMAWHGTKGCRRQFSKSVDSGHSKSPQSRLWPARGHRGMICP